TRLAAGALVTDVGSTKRSIVQFAAKILPKTVRFVGSHPMAGSEKRGVEHARADLFRDAICVVTPDAQTDPGALAAIEAFWTELGMSVRRMLPEAHDAAVAAVSHLPHAIAAALVRLQDESSLSVSGKGFLDATRIAAG